eukprot:4788823-Pleurochrysis_carterae.AAC.1
MATAHISLQAGHGTRWLTRRSRVPTPGSAGAQGFTRRPASSAFLIFRLSLAMAFLSRFCANHKSWILGRCKRQREYRGTIGHAQVTSNTPYGM